MTAIRENGATSGAGVLATFAYDHLGRRTQNLSGTASDVTLTFGDYSPAGQLGSRTVSNDAYSRVTLPMHA